MHRMSISNRNHHMREIILSLIEFIQAAREAHLEIASQ